MEPRHTSNDKEKYTEAGEQAARVIGDFISMANEFSKKLDQSFSADSSRPDGAKKADAQRENRFRSASGHTADRQPKDAYSKNQQNSEQAANTRSTTDQDWQQAGAYLRELRETAGYTIDGFASALNRHDATRTVEAAEAGREVFPKDWFDQAIAVLKHRDPLEFFDKLQSCYQPTAAATEVADATAQEASSQRQQKLSDLFSDSAALAELTDGEFEELHSFMQSNYRAALQLVRKK